MDSIFGVKKFRNEIVWHYRRWTNVQNQFQKMHDIIFFYTKGDEWIFNPIEVEYSKSQKKKFERGWDQNVVKIKGKMKPQLIVYNQEKVNDAIKKGRINTDRFARIINRGRPKVVSSDVIIMPVINSQARERLGYPTQKPEALLSRIIQVSSNDNEIILDPFCGCGTTITVAEKLNRKWIGIDVTHLAIALMKHRLKDTFGDKLKYEVKGEPVDKRGAEALAKQDRYQFEWWALSLVGARPAEDEKKKGGDKGIDGYLYFHDEPRGGKTKKILIQVKSGNINPGYIRDLKGVIQREKAQIGVFITLKKPTRGMIKEAVQSGFYHSNFWNKDFPKIQILTIDELLNGKEIDYPKSPVTHKKAKPHEPGEQKKLKMD